MILRPRNENNQIILFTTLSSEYVFIKFDKIQPKLKLSAKEILK